MKAIKSISLILPFFFYIGIFTIVGQSENDLLRDLLGQNNTACQRTCLFGIKPDVTTRREVESTFISMGIQYHVMPGTLPGVASFEWRTPASSTSRFLIPNSLALIGFATNDTVSQITIPVDVPLEVVLEVYGNPNDIQVLLNSVYLLYYIENGLIFQVNLNSSAENVTTIFLLSAPRIDLFLNTIGSKPRGQCTEPSTICEISIMQILEKVPSCEYRSMTTD
jgi:hypothetical protein